MKALILTADGFEDAELTEPRRCLLDLGCEVDVAAPERGRLAGKHGGRIEATLALGEVDPRQYGLLLLPGGKAADTLSRDPRAQALARAFMQAGKVVAAICHGPLILAAAGLLEGRRVTCYPRVAQVLRQAGASYQDAEVVVDGTLVTSRRPADLPAFMRETAALLAKC